MDGIILTTQTSPMLKTQNPSTSSSGSSWESAITIASLPSRMSSCDSIDDGEWDSFGDSGKISSKSTHEKLDLDLRLSTSTMQLVARQEDPERTPVPTPPDANRLQFLFSKYENLVNRQRLVPHELQGSPVESKIKPLGYLARRTNSRFIDDESPRSNHPESGHQAIPHPLVSAAREQKRGISKRKTQRQKKGASRSPSRTKRALASTIQEYEYMQLGEARKAPNGSIEVEVFWAPIFLPCDQLRGEQAIEEAKDLVVRKFGQVAWEMERTKFGCVGTKKR